MISFHFRENSTSPDSQCIPATAHSSSPPETAHDLRLVAGVVEHRPQVVGHAAVNRDPGPYAFHPFDGAHGVDGYPGVSHQRATGLAEHLHPRRHVAQQRFRVGLDAWRLVRGGVGDAQTAAEVEQRPLADPAEHLGHRLEGLEVEDLRPDVRVEPAQLEPRLGAALHRSRHLGERKAELRVGLAGLDVGVGAGLDSRRDADEHALPGALEPVDLVERVHHHVAHAPFARVVQLRLGLVVAVHVDPRRVEATGEREVKLARRGHVARQPLLRHQPERRRGGERLCGVDHLEAVGARSQRLHVRPGAGAHVVLRVHVRGRAELAGNVGEVASAHLEAAVLVQPGAQRIDMGYGHRCHGRRL